MSPARAGSNTDLLYSITDAVTVTAFASNKYITCRECLYHYKWKVMKVCSVTAKKSVFHVSPIFLLSRV